MLLLCKYEIAVILIAFTSITGTLIVNDMCNGLTKYRYFRNIYPNEALKPGRLAKLHKTDHLIDF